MKYAFEGRAKGFGVEAFGWLGGACVSMCIDCYTGAQGIRMMINLNGT